MNGRVTAAVLLIPLALFLASGCRSTRTYGDIESDIAAAISGWQPAKEIRRLVEEADDRPKAAAFGVWWTMRLLHITEEIAEQWPYHHGREARSTPTIEITEVMNRYRISVLRVLMPYGIDLNRPYRNRPGLDQPLVNWQVQVWPDRSVTPELLTFLLENGYDPDTSQGGATALGVCTMPYGTPLGYKRRYEMVQSLLKHGADPNVTIMKEPILFCLLEDDWKNPHLAETIQLLVDAGIDVNVVEERGWTPLDRAMDHAERGPAPDEAKKIVAILKRGGANTGAELKARKKKLPVAAQ
ncbi:MAG: hypothetical protein HN380_20200 [Victivallales bacterium]|jgi:hypothetical protein|nr:hypothetical protein [Victivallales bacterium]